MTESVGNGGEMGFQNVGSAMSFEPFFKMWSDWLRNSMGPMTTVPGASAPWLTKPGISTGEEVEPLPQGAMADDPLLSAVNQAQEANPLSNIVPIDWLELTRALQTLWMREMSNPERAMQVVTDYNRRLFEKSMEVWSGAASRFWGMQQEEEEGTSDPRFSAPEWDSNPYYAMLKEMYFLASEYLLNEAQETADGQEDTEEQRRLRFHLQQFVELMAPVNFLLTNPEALRRAAETGGASLMEGARHLISDIQDGSITQVDEEAFEVGENLAITPGKVVYRNDLMELIQYEPQTEQVYETPILFIPPWINKYYIVDLRPENSFIGHLLEQGFQVFMISWKNPDESYAETKFEDYMTLGPFEAADVARQITGAEKVNPIGYCIGGTLLGITLAYLAAADNGDEKGEAFGAPTFLTAMLDFSDVGDQSAFTDEARIEFMDLQMKELGYLPGQQLSNMFNLLQPQMLIWTHVVNNYLMGQDPPAFDMLYWNSDSTNLPRDAQSWYIRNTYLENNLVEPGKVEVNGRPLDLGKITGEIYAVGTRTDHIAPWKSGWAMCKLTSANIRYALAGGGHIAGVVSPPEKGKGFWVSDDCGRFETADEWLENAEEHDGSWWEDYTEWLGQHSGEQVEPPQVGSDEYPPIEDAPGTYVKETA